MDKDLLIKISADTKEAVEEIKRLEAEIKEFAKDVKTSNASLENQDKRLEKLSSSIKKVVTAYAGFSVLKDVVNAAGSFEQKITNLGAISGAVGDKLEALKEKARELGQSTVFSASEVADGMKYLAMAGYKTKDILASIGDVLNLAVIGQTDLARASDIASNILSGFNLKAEETKRVVDVMTATITNSNTNIEELGYAMAYAAPQAKVLGISVEEASTAIGILSNNGIKGSMAGTGLAQVLTRLSAPTGRAADRIKELGIKIYDAQGKFVGLKNVLMQFQEKLSQLSQADKMRVISDIFGQEAAKSAITLIDNVSQSYDKLYQKIMKSSGASEEMAKKMADTYEGNVKALKSALESLAITIGQELLPALTEIVKKVTTAINSFNEFYSKNRELINTIVELTAIFFGLKKVFGIIEAVLGAKALMNVKSLITGVTSLTSAVRVLQTAFLALGRANAVILALTASIRGLNKAFDYLDEKYKKLDESSKSLQDSSSSLEEIMNTLQKSMYIDENGVKSFRLTKDEIERLKQSTIKLLQADKERLKQLKENSDGSSKYANMIKVLENRQNLLKKTLERLEHIKPYEKAKKSANEYKNKIHLLTEEEKKRIRELQKAQEREINNFKSTYTRRVAAHEEMINSLKQKELKLLNEILEENKKFQAKLKSIEQSRVAAIESIEDKIHNIRMSGASDYEKYIDKQKQAEIKLAKAKEAIKKGELAQAKRYMSEYERLVTSITNTEIKEGNKVLVSKKQSNQYAVNALKKLESLTNSYYAKEKAKATALHNQRIAQLKAQLQATKAQLQLEVQRLNLEKQLIAAVTGKKVNIDTSEALNQIKNLDKQIKELDNQIKKPKKIDADIKKAEEKLKKIDDKTQTDKTIKFNGDTKKVAGVLEIIDKKTGKKRVIKFYGDNKDALKRVNDVSSKAKNLKPVVKVNSDVSRALSALNKIPKTIVTTHIIREVHQRANGGLIPRLNTGGFARYTGRIPGYDPLDSDNVPALLTRGEFVIRREAVKYYGDDFLYKLNNMLLPKFATGGLVEIGKPERLKELISQSSSSGYNSSNSSVSLDSLEDLIERLKEVFEELKSSNSPIVNKVSKEIESLTQIEKERKEIILKNEKLSSQKSSLEESIKGRTLSEYEYEKFKAKKGSIENSLNSTNEKIKAISKKIEEERKKAEKVLREVEKYLEKVEDVKSKIEERLSRFGINMPLEVENSIDLNRLERYLNALDNLRLPNFSSLKYVDISSYEERFKSAINEYLQKARKAYYSSFSTNEAYVLMMRPEPLTKDLLSRYTANNNRLAQKIKNYMPEVDYRTFRANYSLNENAKKVIKAFNIEERFKRKGINVKRFLEDYELDDYELDEIKKEYVLKHLPKFASGGKVPGDDPFSRDDILARVSRGEFIIRRDAVRHYGVDLFDALNNMKLPKFANGGYVGDIPSRSIQEMVNINFTMPNKKSYTMQANIDVAKALAEEFRRIM